MIRKKNSAKKRVFLVQKQLFLVHLRSCLAYSRPLLVHSRPYMVHSRPYLVHFYAKTQFLALWVKYVLPFPPSAFTETEVTQNSCLVLGSGTPLPVLSCPIYKVPIYNVPSSSSMFF